MPLPPILVVEDDHDDIFFLQRAFASAEVSHPVMIARDGQEAIEALEKLIAANQRLPVLMLFDLKMPRRNGLDLLIWVRSIPSARCIPVILHSTSDHPMDIERAYALGANAYVLKPVSSSERTAFAQFLKQWLVFARPSMASVEGPTAARTLLPHP